jgi:hypothetical protein
LSIGRRATRSLTSGIQRAKLVLYAADGATNAEIARRLDMNADVVGRWCEVTFTWSGWEGLRIECARVVRAVPLGRGRAIKAIASTDITASTAELIARYDSRWSIETAHQTREILLANLPKREQRERIAEMMLTRSANA